MQACETVGTEDRPVEAAQHMETASKLMVRCKQEQQHKYNLYVAYMYITFLQNVFSLLCLEFGRF